MLKNGLKPGIRFGLEPAKQNDDFRREYRFRRSWPAIAVLAAFDAAFLIPAIFTFNQASAEWGRLDSLFDLVAALFLSAWLLGWMTAPLIMTSILVLMLAGREVLKASSGKVEIFIGLPFLGITARYDVEKMRNLRFVQPPKKSSKSWRGPHFTFDYGTNTVALGSNVDGNDTAAIRRHLQVATGSEIRRGEAPADVTDVRPEIKKAAPAGYPKAEIRPAGASLSLSSPSTLLLILANLVPVAGSVILGWKLADVMVLYWAESAVIGFFNICKMVVIGRWMALPASLFFLAHFGAFMAVHFLFIYTIFIEMPQAGTTAGGDLKAVAQLFMDLWPALAVLFFSHGFSFYTNFIGRQEYRGRTLNKQMSEPYSRIIFMHMVLIFGGGLSMILGGPVVVLLIVIALKIYFDVRAHLKQHAGIEADGKPV